MTRFGLLAVTGLGSLWIVLAPWGVTAEQASQPREGDVAAIRRAGQEYVAALRRGDAEALAAHWVPGGMYMDATDRSFDARALIQQQFGSDPPQGVVRSVEVDANSSIRFVTADVAIEEGTARDANGTDAGRGRFTAVWVKKGPRWLLESLREWQPKSSSPKSSLEALAWMLGKWVG
ncbi:MAG: DUF4440 domain-containing protein, partial [Planctomycetales bacterium]|nr:DUF4440 domain-containing protein [Planctomycetales bacterium]NIM08420.1 DUF4440 domain-containing protein [Planctomycetales bacterium]NIN07896.1 DUF4440 domain-containing protein [Planctomycetales bacterium]NIN77026.1 DUF4440 domain-containing protein [Planctomycetales bacterium]NIO34208.1 DUF4440 domain-containing protein [Planctomycetales bacterium]